MNFSESLFRLVEPIINMKFESLRDKYFHRFFQNDQNYFYKENRTIKFLNNEIIVHKNFRMCFIIQKVKMEMSCEIFNKV